MDFHPVFLNEMQGAELQNRLDFKFVFQRCLLEDILEQMMNSYRVLEINGVRLQHYETLYFDTEDYKLYHAHHNQRSSRVKIRIRHYASNQLTFAEVKNKLNTGRVVKKRIAVESLKSGLPSNVLAFTGGRDMLQIEDLKPGVMVNFDRVTFVALNGAERVTLDLNLEMYDDQKRYTTPDLIIAELKLYKKDNSVFTKIMQQLRVRPWGVSKYCLAISMLKDNVRKNNFKPVHTYLNKLQNNTLNGTGSV